MKKTIQKKLMSWLVVMCITTFLFTSKTIAQTLPVLQPSASSFNNGACQTVGIDNCYSPNGGMSYIASSGIPSKPYFSIEKYKLFSSNPMFVPKYVVDKTHFIVANNGNVGIGKANPSSNLSIYGTNLQNWNSGIELLREDGGKAYMTVANQGLNFRTMVSGSGFYFRNLSNIINLIIQENGFVGIGIDTPGEKLHVNGNERVDGNSTINGNGTINGNSTINGNETINGYLMIKGNTNSTSSGSNEILLGADGYIRAREIKVDLDNIPTPDYVFKAGYKLMPLEDLKRFVEKTIIYLT